MVKDCRLLNLGILVFEDIQSYRLSLEGTYWLAYIVTRIKIISGSLYAVELTVDYCSLLQ